jgi:cytochrome c oxidase subunit 4
MPEPTSTTTAVPGPPGPRDTPHIASPAVLLVVWITLLILTAATLAAAQLPTGGYPALGLWIAMGLATFKATLVALYFMHLRYDRPFHAIIFVTALVFVLLLVSLTFMDSEQYEPDIRRYREQTRQP